MQTRTKLLAVKIVHHGFDSIAYGIADDDVLDVVEKVRDGIDVDERLLVRVDTSDEIVGNDDELGTDKATISVTLCSHADGCVVTSSSSFVDSAWIR